MRTLIATMSVLAPGKNGYSDNLECWLKQMVYEYNKSNVAVIMGHKNNDHIRLCAKYNVPIIPVTPLWTGTSEDPSYAWQNTKLHLFSLPYDRILYFDMDFLFYGDPEQCLDLCTSDLCGVEDHFLTDRFKRRPKGYINAGMMIIKPTPTSFFRLRRAMKTRKPSTFAEQDTINAVFKAQLLPKKCNLLLSSARQLGAPNLVHEKIKNVLPQKLPSVCRSGA